MPTVQKQTMRNNKPTRSKRKQSVVDRIGEDWGDGEGIKVLVYGRSGTGKTTLWSTFPKPILAILASGPIKPGELKSIKTRENKKTIYPVSISSSEELDELVAYQQETNKYATIVLDHASGLQDLKVKEIGEFEDIQIDKFRKAGRGEAWGIISQGQWGQVGNQMKQHLRDLLNLDCNVVIVAQEREFNVDNESDLLMPYVGAGLTPSVVGWLNPACDYIINTFIRGKTEEKKTKVGGKTVTRTVKQKGVEYCLRTGPDEVFTTKFRTPKGHTLPDLVVDPDYDKIVSIINGG